MALTLVGGRRAGKTALQWHKLQQESARVDRPILCVECERQHPTPPQFGKCQCGSYVFGIQSDRQLPLLVEATRLDIHGGEQ